MMRAAWLFPVVLPAVVTIAAAQEPVSPRKLYEAGQYQQAVEAVLAGGESADPSEVYLAAESYSRLDQRDAARDTFRRLDNGDDQNPWTLVARSAVAALDGDLATAHDAASRAVELAPDAFHSQYQLGLVNSLREDFGGATAALDRATQIDPNHAYAHYYAGLAFNKTRKIDQMARHLRAFVSLAPEAPERPQVETILRTLRR